MDKEEQYMLMSELGGLAADLHLSLDMSPEGMRQEIIDVGTALCKIIHGKTEFGIWVSGAGFIPGETAMEENETS